MARKGRPSQGRKKIEMKKIESEEARHVCFSKRRIGVFTKASELSTMCGAQVAVVVYSPSGTPYSFGSPSVDSVVDSFLAQSPVRAPPNPNIQCVINSLSKEYMEASAKLTAEKRKKAMLDERVKEASKSKEFEWLQNMNQLGLNDLNQLLACLNQAKNSLNERIKALLLSHGRAMTANMGFVHGMPSNFDSAVGTMARAAPPPPLAPTSGTIVSPMNYARNPFMPGSF
jgi:SRF-type transcription factor (DNA-binding and dimerisation domain)